MRWLYNRSTKVFPDLANGSRSLAAVCSNVFYLWLELRSKHTFRCEFISQDLWGKGSSHFGVICSGIIFTSNEVTKY